MSFFHKKNVTKFMGHHYANILLAQKIFFQASLWLSLISGTVISSKHVSNGPWLLPFPVTDQSIILQKGGGFQVFMILDLLSLVSKKC
jgi:hypothetical protein